VPNLPSDHKKDGRALKPQRSTPTTRSLVITALSFR